MYYYYFEVVLPVPLNRSFTYSYVSESEGNFCGCRVLVSFGRGRLARDLVGVVVSQSLSSEPIKTSYTIKSIIELLDLSPIFSDKMISFLYWLSSYYLCPIGEVFRSALPSIFSPRLVRKFFLNTDKSLTVTSELSSARRRILDFLAEKKESVSLSDIENACEVKNIQYHINYLLAHDYISFLSEKKESVKIKYCKSLEISSSLLSDDNLLAPTLLELEKKSPRQFQVLNYLLQQQKDGNTSILLSEVSKLFSGASSAVRALVAKELISIVEIEVTRNNFSGADKLAFRDESLLDLTSEQEFCFSKIKSALKTGKYSPFLLHGVTGSGKTLVYIHAIKEALSLGKNVLVLVPEISLTPQLIDRFEIVFPGIISVFHSRMSDGERYDSWRSVVLGKVRVVLGTRSALFSPLSNLGLIIVDEEHDSSYKQDGQLPYYNAKDAALYRGKLEEAVVVLGSATPSLESYYNSGFGKLQLLEIKERADGAVLPTVELIDMVSARASGQVLHGFSRILIDKIKEKLSSKEGIILFQNKRGYSNFLECKDCGHIPQCKYCSVSLTYHHNSRELRCHYCGYTKRVINTCEVCGSNEMYRVGIGTQRAEADLASILLSEGIEAKIARLDLDTTARKGSHRKILQSFFRGETDILLGTQIVAKGLDFERVTLVGVINADIQLNLPDFRSCERTFQLLSQVSGRAGRSGDLPGEVLIQTYNISNYAIQAAANSNYKDFYEIELEKRKTTLFPPFVRYCLIEFSSKEEKEVIQAAKNFHRLLASGDEFIIYPPSPAPVSKLNNYFRHQISIKNIKKLDPNGTKLQKMLSEALNKYNEIYPSKVKIKIDIDSFSSF